MRNKTYIISIILLMISIIGILTLKPAITGFAIQETTLDSQTTLAIDSLLEAEKNILDLKVLNLTTFQSQDKLLEAKKHFLGKDFPLLRDEFDTIQDPNRYEYSQLLLETFSDIPSEERLTRNLTKSIQLSNEIKTIKQNTLNLLDRISLLETQEENSRDEFNTEKTLELLEQAKTSFYGERLNETNNLLTKAESQLNTETTEYKRIFSLSQNFLRKYWIHITIVIMILIISLFAINKKLRIVKARLKLKKYRIELESLNGLIKKTQLLYFKDRKLSKRSYDIRLEKYRKRINKIKTEIPVLENLIKK